MSEIFEVTWKAYGTASVEADSPDEAKQIMTDAIYEFSDIDIDIIQVDGSEVADA